MPQREKEAKGIDCPKNKVENTPDSELCIKCAAPLPYLKEIPVTETLETPTEELIRGATFAGRYDIIEESVANDSYSILMLDFSFLHVVVLASPINKQTLPKIWGN